MNIGLFGGSFNPIHKGHLALAQTICNEGLVDELWFLVSPQNPFKQNLTLLADEKRLQLVQLAIADDNRLKACDIEFSLPRPSYTWTTLQALHTQYPEHQFTLVIGGDNWEKFPHWYHHKDIMATTQVLVYPREGSELHPKEMPQGVSIIQAPLFPYSSTDVRKTIANGEDASEMLPLAVWQQIQSDKLYQAI